MNSTLESTITEADIQLFIESFCCSREYAIHLLEVERESKIQFIEYLKSPFDPRD